MAAEHIDLIWLGWLVMALWMFVLWLVERATRDAGIVDVGWAAGLTILACLYALLAGGWPLRRVLIAAMAGFWGLRLALHLLFDRVLKGPEDGRYRSIRANWGGRAGIFFFWFFQAQALLDVILSAPFLIICANPAPRIHLLEYAGAAVWLCALAAESIADGQLKRFRADPAHKGRTCRAGLWRYSRHPNYFFEWLIWCGFGLMALAAPLGWIGLISPFLIYLLINHLTGIPPTEAQALRSRGDDYRDYQRTTPAFFPWFPRRRAT